MNDAKMKRTAPDCLCDSFYNATHSECEASSGFLCELLASDQTEPTFHFNGAAIDKTEAVQLVGRLLKEADYPLITGLENVGVESQKAAANVARVAGGVIDSGWNDSSFAWNATMARVGMVTATIGEATLRNDIVVVVDGDPWSTHPRLANQLAESAKTLIYLGTKSKLNASVPWARTIFLAGEGLESLLIKLRMSLTNELSNLHGLDSRNGELEAVLQTLGNGRHVTFLACDNEGVTSDSQYFCSTADSLVELAVRLNKTTRSVVLSLKNSRNSYGSENVLTWNFGFPRGIDLTQKSARNFGDEFSTRNVVNRCECDLLLAIGEVPIGLLNETSIDHLASNPIISFAWGDRTAWPPALLKPSTFVEVRNLGLLPDDFIRLDDATFELGKEHGSDVSKQLHLREFLESVVKNTIL